MKKLPWYVGALLDLFKRADVEAEATGKGDSSASGGSGAAAGGVPPEE